MNNYKKKILYIITKSNWGGAQRNVFDLATNIPGDKFEVLVAVGGNGPLVEKLNQKNIKTISINGLGRDIKFFSDIKAFFSIIKIIRAEKPEVVHLHSPKAGGLGALAVFILNLLKTKNRKLKTIYTSHGFTFNEDRFFLEIILIKLFTWIIFILSNKIIILTEKERDSIKSWPFVHNKISIIPLGIKSFDFLEKNEAQRVIEQKLSKSFPDGSILIGTVAELHKNKGLSFAIEAIKNLPSNIFYIIIGEGEERKNIEKKMKDLSLENRVFLTGYISSASSLLKAFNIFLLPSIKEGLPYVLLEAGRAEVPIVSTNVGGIPELIINEASGILINPSNSEEIRTKIEYIIKNTEKSIGMKINLNKSIENKYSLQQMIINTSNLY